MIVTARKQSLRRLFFQRCLSVHRGSAALHAGYTPRQVYPLGRYTPLGRYIPWAGTPPWTDTPFLPIACWDAPPLPSACWDTPPLQCMLGYGQQADSMHPTGMHSCSVLLLRQKYWLFIYASKYNFPYVTIAKPSQNLLKCLKQSKFIEHPAS